MLSRAVVSALLCAICLAIPSQAGASAFTPPAGKVFTGVAMGLDFKDFQRRTGKRPAVWEQFVSWNHNYRWAVNLALGAGTRLMLHLSTAPGQDRAGEITPGAIAAGRGDHWLLSLREDLANLGLPVYLRFLGEMNNCHNAYAPLNCNGSSRGRAYSSQTFIRAWRRVAAIMRGTTATGIEVQLARLHQPPLQWSAGPMMKARIAMVWTPMTGGSPMVGALDPGRFWPGRRWVDWVGTSFYSKYPNFRWLTPYYERFSARAKRPFMFAELAMWDNSDPGFVRQTIAWIHSHRRTKMLVYNQGKDPVGPFRLGHFPGAASALRQGLGGSTFL